MEGILRVLLVLGASSSLALAWKPISGSTAAYSLKQSHPGSASSSHELSTSFTDPTGAGENDEDTQLLLSRARPGISFEDQYESYSLEDAIPPKDLGFTRTPLYGSNECSVKKFAFNQDGEVEYGNHLPELDQFTICFWMRFTNHTGDHVLLTYEGE